MNNFQFSKYPRGGFEQKMSKSEAAKILGVPYNAKPDRIKDAHKRIMIVNHPDRGIFFYFLKLEFSERSVDID
jgi:DnaJ-domain-containing protein 1